KFKTLWNNMSKGKTSKYYQKCKKDFPKQLKHCRSALCLWKRLIHGGSNLPST
ncbi:Hypothetical predicted protein, partial [Paramuricea clavata]